MKSSDLETGAGRIVRGVKDLQAAWETASEDWHDEVARAFHKDHLEPIPPAAKAALDAVGRLRQLLGQAHRELQDGASA